MTISAPVTRPNLSDRPSEFSICSSAARVWLSSAYWTRLDNSQLTAMRPAVGATQVSSMRAMLPGIGMEVGMRRELIAHDAKHHDGRQPVQQPDELRNERLRVLHLGGMRFAGHRRVQGVLPDHLGESAR